LANAYHIKAVPGRKTDVKDCEWIANLLAHGLIRASFIPPPPIRDLRDLTRHRKSLIRDRVKATNRVHKLLQCRQLLERLQADGVVTLPALRKLEGRRPRREDLSQPLVEPEPVECAASECEPLELALVEGEAESRRWRVHVESYHCLGWRVPFGANLRYWVRNRDRELACLLWTSPAWKMHARDAWIGWSSGNATLQWIVNNGRFLILPWVRVKGLASKILALSARHVPSDWQIQYGYRPLLLETLVDTRLMPLSLNSGRISRELPLSSTALPPLKRKSRR